MVKEKSKTVFSESHTPTERAAYISCLLATARKAALDAGQAILEVYASESIAMEAKADGSPVTIADEAAHNIILQQLQTTGLPILSEEGAALPYEERKHWQWFWLVDPLDGTREFLNRNGEFTVNIALMYQHEPVAGVVHAPTLSTLYYGSRETGVTKEANGEATQLNSLAEKRNFDVLLQQSALTVVASKSHLSPETVQFISKLSSPRTQTMGSSLKFMLLAEAAADIYPRFGPTMEWDTAASHAILSSLNRGVYQTDLMAELEYNKPDLHNPSFIAF